MVVLAMQKHVAVDSTSSVLRTGCYTAGQAGCLLYCKMAALTKHDVYETPLIYCFCLEKSQKASEKWRLRPRLALQVIWSILAMDITFKNLQYSFFGA